MSDDLRDLAHDLAEAPRGAQIAAAAATEASALKVKNGWRRNARRSAGRHAKRYPSSISYDVDTSLGSAFAGRIGAEIGPDKSRPQGALGNLIEFGSVNNPPNNDGGRALRDEAPAYERAIAQATLDALGWH